MIYFLSTILTGTFFLQAPTHITIPAIMKGRLSRCPILMTTSPIVKRVTEGSFVNSSRPLHPKQNTKKMPRNSPLYILSDLCLYKYMSTTPRII